MALSSKKSGFVYKPRTSSAVKERANRKGAMFDSIFKQGTDEYRPRTGDNGIRYLPPTWDDSEHYGFTAHVHNNIGPDNSTYLCLRKMLNKPCPCCEAQKEAKDAGEAEEAKALSTSERVISYVLDRDGDDPEKPLAYNQSWTQDRDVTALCVNERTGEILMIDHPDKGYDVFFKRQGTGLKTKYYGWQIDRSDSPIHDKQKVQDEILDYIKDNPIPDILNYFSYDYLKGVLSGKVEKPDEDMDDEKPARGRGRAAEEEDEAPFDETPSRTRGPRRDQEEEEEEQEEKPARGRSSSRRAEPEEEEEQEEKPARSSRRRTEPEDEEVNEEEEQEEKPARGRASSRRAEPEEEEEEQEEKPARRNSRVR